MTSVKGAGYSSAGNRKVFDPLQQASAQGPAPPLVQKTANSPEHQAKEMEKVVNKLIEDSAEANVAGDFATALDKAKQAQTKERVLNKHREKHGLGDQQNFDLTFAVTFNLANQFHASGMLTEALHAYSVLVKNKNYPLAGRLRVNMGNIYFQQKKYPAAIKMYRMAMDQINSTSKDMRFRILRNIGAAFIKLGQFQEAIQSFENIMDNAADAQTGFNLILCYYPLGDRDKMKKAFTQLLSVQSDWGDDEEEEEEESYKELEGEMGIKQDELKKDRAERRKQYHHLILTAAKLIAPVIEKDMAIGYDWVCEMLRQPRKVLSQHGEGALSRPGFPSISMELEIAKGIAYLKKKQIQAAIDVFKDLERKDQGLIVQAATNLSFVYFLEGDMKNAEKYAEAAVRADRYNAKALVNKANILFVKGDLDGSKELFLEAIGVEADCVEAIYNLGLTYKKLNFLEEALQAFKKLHRIVPKDTQVVYQIANLFELLGDLDQATEWFKLLHGSVQTDTKVLARLGGLYNKLEDETQAFQNFHDAYMLYPVSMEVISWLGIWYVKAELYEDAIQYFERAAEIEPGEVKWQLMVASCYRRMGAYPQALALYKRIHKDYPDNIECLRYLCSICKDMNDPQYEDYSKMLKKAERQMAMHANQFNAKQDAPPSPPGGGRAQGRGPLDTPSSSPTMHTKSITTPIKTPKKDLNESFSNSLSPKHLDGPSINQGRTDADDWGDGDLPLDL